MAEQKKEKLGGIRTAKDIRTEELTEKDMEKLSGGVIISRYTINTTTDPTVRRR